MCSLPAVLDSRLPSHLKGVTVGFGLRAGPDLAACALDLSFESLISLLGPAGPAAPSILLSFGCFSSVLRKAEISLEFVLGSMVLAVGVADRFPCELADLERLRVDEFVVLADCVNIGLRKFDWLSVL